MDTYISISLLALVAIVCLLSFFRRLQKRDFPQTIDVNNSDLNEPQIKRNNVQEWIEKEKPYQYITEADKQVLQSIGTSINKVARNGAGDNAIRIYDRLIRNNVLKEKLVVYRGVEDQNYERRLAVEKGLYNKYLYYNGYVFCSLNADTYYWNSRKTKMIISLPAGTHYLYTGKYSNTPESNEIVLDKNSILQIDDEVDYNGEHYMWLTLVNTPKKTDVN